MALPRKKQDIDRFKKTMHGLIEFAILIEQASPKMRDRIISDTEKYERVFLNKVMRRVVFFEEMIYIDTSIVSEIISRSSPRVVAYATFGMSPSEVAFFTRLMGIRENHEFKDELERMPNGVPRNFVLGAQRSLLKLARDLEAQNKFVFECLNCPRLTKKKSTG